jgi:hypothetical protein
MLEFFSVNTFCQKDVVGITRHVATTISAFSFTMLLLDINLTHIVNHISITSYHLQYLYCQGGYVFGAKPNLICVGYIFLSVVSMAAGRRSGVLREYITQSCKHISNWLVYYIMN